MAKKLEVLTKWCTILKIPTIVAEDITKLHKGKLRNAYRKCLLDLGKSD